MSKASILAVAGALLAATPAFAEGDAAEGEKEFRKCQSCHAVKNDAGEVLAGKGTSGPNLFGVAGRTAGSLADFNFKDSIVAAGEKGLAWNEEEFVKYLQDPTKYLRDYLGDDKARSGMSFKLRSEEDAANVWAYLVSLAPES